MALMLHLSTVLLFHTTLFAIGVQRQVNILFEYCAAESRSHNAVDGLDMLVLSVMLYLSLRHDLRGPLCLVLQ